LVATDAIILVKQLDEFIPFPKRLDFVKRTATTKKGSYKRFGKNARRNTVAGGVPTSTLFDELSDSGNT